jgi:hypothetical protein
MAPTSSYDASELHRTLSSLNETKLTLTFKLNLLRSTANSSSAQLATFDDLIDRLVDAGREIWALEACIKEKENSPRVFIAADDDDDEVRHALKQAMALVGSLDVLGEEVMRLKFALEAVDTGTAGTEKNMVKKLAAAGRGGVAGAEGSQHAAKEVAPTRMGSRPVVALSQQLRKPFAVSCVPIFEQLAECQ